MSNDPHSISLDTVLQALRDLGLDPVDPGTIRSVAIDPTGITVVRYRLDERGHKYGVGDSAATETTLIRIGRNSEVYVAGHPVPPEGPAL